jgi:anti-anti-sigma regulatory factor
MEAEGAFGVVSDTDTVLTIELGEHGLDGEVDELLVFIRSRLTQSHHDLIELDASDTAIVTLEGIGALLRLVRESERVGTALQVVSPHPALERKLRQTGTLEPLTSHETGDPPSR